MEKNKDTIEVGDEVIVEPTHIHGRDRGVYMGPTPVHPLLAVVQGDDGFQFVTYMFAIKKALP